MFESTTVTVGLDGHARSIRLAAVRATEVLEDPTHRRREREADRAGERERIDFATLTLSPDPSKVTVTATSVTVTEIPVTLNAAIATALETSFNPAAGALGGGADAGTSIASCGRSERGVGGFGRTYPQVRRPHPRAVQVTLLPTTAP